MGLPDCPIEGQPPVKHQRVIEILLVSGLLLAFALQCWFGMQLKTPSYDEKYHLAYGMNVLRGDPVRHNFRFDSKMPVSALNALPLLVTGVHYEKDLPVVEKAAQRVTIVFGVLLGILIFVWSRGLYGPAGGLLSLSLFAFSPDFIAHSQLVTTDVYAALFMTAALWSFWHFLKSPDYSRAALCGLLIGVAQIAKNNCVYLYPILILILFLKGLLWLIARPAGTRLRPGRSRLFRAAGMCAVFLLINLLLINAGFLFHGFGSSLGTYHFKSEVFLQMQSRLHFMSSLPLPLPEPFLSGLDWVMFNERTGVSFKSSYLLGELRQGAGFWNYYFVAFLYKVPLATQALLLAALIVHFLKRKQLDIASCDSILLLPAVFFFVYLSFFYRAQIGIRHLIIIFPLLYIFCGSLFSAGISGRWKLPAVCLLLVFQVWSVVSYYPHYLSYFNELLPDKSRAFEILADSNLDWHQNRRFLKAFLRHNPDVIVSPEGPVASRVIVPVNELVGLFGPERYRWLRENFRPVGHVAYSYILFDCRGGG